MGFPGVLVAAAGMAVLLIWEGKVGRTGCDGVTKRSLTCRNISTGHVNICYTILKKTDLGSTGRNVVEGGCGDVAIILYSLLRLGPIESTGYKKS